MPTSKPFLPVSAALGVAVYPHKAPLATIKKYLAMCAQNQVTRVFMNLIGLPPTGLVAFQEIAAFARQLGLRIVADVDESVCAFFHKTVTDTPFWLELGVTALRLDVKFPPAAIAALTLTPGGLEVEINASDFSHLIDEITAHPHEAHRLRASHNFYPQRFTGLSVAKWQAANVLHEAHNVKVSAFVTLGRSNLGAWDDHEGAPTLEICRDLTLAQQVSLLSALGQLDCLFVSEMFVSQAQLQAINALKPNHYELRLVSNALLSATEQEVLHYAHHALRGDNPDAVMFRSTISRKVFKTSDIPPRAYAPAVYPAGSVLILNNAAGRYKGEVHVLRTPLPASASKNYVGHLLLADIALLDHPVHELTFSFHFET